MYKKKKKIGLVVHYLAYGGLARATANISIALDKMGYEVFIVTVHPEVSFEYAGTLINMGAFKSKNNGFLNRLNRFLILKKRLSKIKVDVFIDLRTRTSFLKEYLLNTLLYQSKVVYTIRNADYQKYICFNPAHFKKLCKKSYGLLTVSHWLEEEFKNNLGISNTSTMYNAINREQILKKTTEAIDLVSGFILAVGQMDNDLKGFDHLIKAYAMSTARKNNQLLVIIGTGKRLNHYQKLAETLQVAEEVLFLGSIDNPFKYYARANFFVLSSKNEGFPNVILEALTCGCPVISYDCLSGPSEIITPSQNGLLVKNQDVKALSKAINTFIENDTLRNYCKLNAQKSVEKFSFENIGKAWQQYLDKIIT